LAIAGCVAIIEYGANYALVGMTISLIADGYFGIRYTEETDEIQFNIIELFSRESWCQECFDRMDNLIVQIAACTIIFA